MLTAFIFRYCGKLNLAFAVRMLNKTTDRGCPRVTVFLQCLLSASWAKLESGLMIDTILKEFTIKHGCRSSSVGTFMQVKGGEKYR